MATIPSFYHSYAIRVTELDLNLTYNVDPSIHNLVVIGEQAWMEHVSGAG